MVRNPAHSGIELEAMVRNPAHDNLEFFIDEITSWKGYIGRHTANSGIESKIDAIKTLCTTN